MRIWKMMILSLFPFLEEKSEKNKEKREEEERVRIRVVVVDDY